MRSTLRGLVDFLEQQSPGRTWAATTLLTLALGWLDYATGFEISFAFFYLLPVALAAWVGGQAAGLLTSFACAAIWLTANLFAGEQYSSALIPYWNAVTRLGFFAVVTWLLAELRQLLEHERALARTDFLTGVLNRRAFYDQAGAELARSGRFQHPLTLLYIDLDNFKAVNDQLGHASGDRLLQVVAHTITRSLRAIDTVARLGGDEFAVLLPETDEAAARVVTPRVRQALLAEMARHRWPVTFSIGALTCRQAPADGQALIQFADQLMYGVKNSTKDAIRYAVHPPTPAA